MTQCQETTEPRAAGCGVGNGTLLLLGYWPGTGQRVVNSWVVHYFLFSPDSLPSPIA